MARSLSELADAIRALLREDAEVWLAAGKSAHDWHKRIQFLAVYSLPPEHVEHTQRPDGSWQHRIRSGA